MIIKVWKLKKYPIEKVLKELEGGKKETLPKKDKAKKGEKKDVPQNHK